MTMGGLDVDYYVPFVALEFAILAIIAWTTLYKYPSWFLCCLPLLLMATPDYPPSKLFSVAKLLAMVVVTCLITSVRYWTTTTWLRRAIVVVVIVNILEATVQDFFFQDDVTPELTSLSKGAYMVNGLSGLLLIAQTIPRWRTISVKDATINVQWWPDLHSRVMLFTDLPRVWIWSYTVWHVTFMWGFASKICDALPTKTLGVYTLGNIPQLVVPIIADLCMPGLWVQVRGYTLLFMLAILRLICIHDLSEYSFALTDWYSDVGHITLALMALAVNIAGCVHHFSSPLARGDAIMLPDTHKEDGTEDVALNDL